MKSKKMQERNYETWVSQIPETKPTQRAQRKRAYRYWLDFLKPHDEIWVLENLDSEDWAQHLCDFRDYLAKQPLQRGEGFLSDNTTRTLANVIRGYLRHVRASLHFEPTQKQHMTKIEKQVRMDYPFNIRVKEKLISVSSPTEEWIVCGGVSFGLRIGDFLTITRGQLEPLINQEPPIPLGKIQTEKEGEPAYPYISGDAKQAIIRRVKEMDRLGKTDDSERMIDLNEQQTNETLQNLFKKAKIGLGEYSVHFHILRQFLTDNLSSVSSSDKWKRIVGKSSKSPYIKNEASEAYKRVMPLIDVNGDRLRGSTEEIENLRTTIHQQEKEIIGLQTRVRELQNGLNKTSTTLNKTTSTLDMLVADYQKRNKKTKEKVTFT